jgi:hypothetical protein
MPAGGAPSAAADDPVVVVVVSGRKRRRKQQAAAASAAAERRLRSRPTHRLSAHSSPLRADTAAATAAACGTLRFRIGDSVVIGGLQRAPQYNDLEGVVVASPPGAPGCGVRLWLDGEHKTLLLPAEQLRPLHHAAPSVAAAAATSMVCRNPYLALYTNAVASWPPDMQLLLDPALPASRRAELAALDVAGGTCKVLDEEAAAALKYAWAIPDERALRILGSMGPLVEVGCGLGYWARLLRDRGVDIAVYDIELPPRPKRWTKVRRGGPMVLSKHSDRTLFLCYPDDTQSPADEQQQQQPQRRTGEQDDESMAASCLRHYTGDTLVHVGELLFESVCRPSPWGRTTRPAFQLQLGATFHRVLSVPLPSWPTSRDSLSVWRRSAHVTVDDQLFAFVPPAERVDLAAGIAAPAFAHLL